MTKHTATLIILVETAAIVSLVIFAKDKGSIRQEHTALDLTCGFTQDFTQFLKDNNYAIWGFDRPDIKCAAFGGKTTSSQQVVKTPIIFVHGNSDIGFGDGQGTYSSWQTGFRNLAIYFGSQGYTKAQLYTTTWGTANILDASLNNHGKNYILQIRAFVEAVLAYTKAPYVDIISHSMGVTIARKVAQGGTATDQRYGTYNVGPSLKAKIRNFVGIAGGNLGLTACWTQQAFPTCSNVDGFYPGVLAVSGPSKYLAQLNRSPGAEAQNVYTIWSKFDTVVGGECVVWGKVTCRIPGQREEEVKRSVQWSHLALRDNSGPNIMNWINK